MFHLRPWGRSIVKTLIELLRWAHQRRAANVCKRPEQGAGIFFFRGDRPLRYPLSGPIAIGLECPIVFRIHQRAQGLPLGVGSQHDVSGLLGGRDEAVDGALVMCRELFGKHVADESERLVQPKCYFGVTDVEVETVASCLQAGTEIPEIEARLSLALLQFLRNE